MAIRESTPDYVRDSVRQILAAAANLWVWERVVEAQSLPVGQKTSFIYPRDMALGGPILLNGKRVRITLEVEDE